MLSELLATSPVLRGTGGGNDNDGSFVDDNMDPELAEALRLSLAAENERLGKTGNEGGGNQSNPQQQQQQPNLGGSFNDDPELAEAIRMSLLENQGPKDNEGAGEPMDEEDELARAIALSRETASIDRDNDEKEKKEKDNSMQIEKKETPKDTSKDQDAIDMSSIEPEFMTDLLLNLPGIDVDDPEVQELLKGMKEEKEKKDEKDEKK